MNVLIVDDNETNRKLLRVMLEAEGLKAHEAHDGEHALQVLEQSEIDAVVSDILMPKMDGYQLCHAMRKTDQFKSTPFVFYSNTYTSGASEALANEFGASRFIRKPAKMSTMVAALREIIQKSKKEPFEPSLATEPMAEQNDQLKQARERLLATNHQLLVQTRELEQTQEKLSSLNAALENAIEGIGYLDTDRRFLTANAAFARITGFPQQEMAGLDWFEIFLSEEADKMAALYQKMLQEGKATTEAKGRRKDGSTCYLELILVADFDPKRSLKGSHCFVKDVTSRQKAQEGLLVAQSQLEAANRDLRRKNEEINNFYHTLSHELKTPLTSAREFISLLIDGTAGPLSDLQNEHLVLARESCDQLTYCINDLLDATRLETGKLAVQLEPGSLGEVISRVVTGMESAAAEKEICLRAELDADLPDALMDDHRMAQVVSNLLGNALKFTSAGGLITVSARASALKNGFLEVSVTDNGRGMPEDQLDIIFDRLYQIKDGDAATGQGVGLGLYLCKELVQLHGGEIHAVSEPGKGSRFTFTIPRHQPAKKPRVLLVEDDPKVAELTTHVLEKGGFNVRLAPNGKEALTALGEFHPAVVILDLDIPVLNGPSTLKELRRQCGALPVIIYTGHPDGELMTRAMESSPFTILAKPCPPEKLLDTIRRMKDQADTQFWRRRREEHVVGAFESFSSATL